VLGALEAKGVSHAFTHAVVRAVMESARDALARGAHFDAHDVLAAAEQSRADDGTMGALRKRLMEELPEQDDLDACMTSLLRKHLKLRAEELRSRMRDAMATDPDVVTRLSRELQDLQRRRESLS